LVAVLPKDDGGHARRVFFDELLELVVMGSIGLNLLSRSFCLLAAGSKFMLKLGSQKSSVTRLSFNLVSQTLSPSIRKLPWVSSSGSSFWSTDLVRSFLHSLTAPQYHRMLLVDTTLLQSQKLWT
jgi:hypothetical protein